MLHAAETKAEALLTRAVAAEGRAREHFDRYEDATHARELADKMHAAAEKEIASLHAALKNVESQRVEAQAQLDAANAVISSIQQSSSWRLTAPLRRLSTLFR